MALYKPTTKVRTLQIPFKVLVVRADPAFEVSKHREVFYEFTRAREFVGDNSRAGPYSKVPPDNPPMD